MKALILILLSFTAIADNNIELTGDLDITGTNETAATAITYDLEGNAVQICIGLTLNGGTGGGGGGGGGINQGFQDLGTSIVLSGDNNETATNPGTNSLGQYVKSVTGHSSGYHKFELLYLDQSNTASQGALGLVRNSPPQTWLGNNADMLGLWGFSSAGNLYQNSAIISTDAQQVIRENFVLSVYVRDGQRVWLEVHDTEGTTFNYMIGGGDPETDTDPTFTFPSAGTIFAAFTPYGNTADQAAATLRTTAAEFDFPTRGATPWDAGSAALQ
jgi:hypothetical protein